MVMIGPLAAALIPAAAGLIGTGISAVAGARGERGRRRWDAAEAQKARDFSERMRNTEWQAGVADMEAAGINPALAYQQGGASSPSGAMASGAQNEAHSALSMIQMQKSINLLNEQITKTREEGRGAKAAADLSSERTRYLTKGRRMTKDGYGPPLLRELIMAEVDSVRAGATNLSAQSERTRELTKILGPGATISSEAIQPILDWLLRGAKSNYKPR